MVLQHKARPAIAGGVGGKKKVKRNNVSGLAVREEKCRIA